MAALSFLPVPFILLGSFAFQKRIAPRYTAVREEVGHLNTALENRLAGPFFHAIELIEFGLQGGARLIEQEQDEILESQLASAGKVLRVLAVGIDEGGTIERAGYFLYNFQARVCWAMSNSV